MRKAYEMLPSGNLCGLFFRNRLLACQSALARSFKTFHFTRRGPSLHGHCPASTLLWPRPTSADTFAPQTSQVPDATFQTRRPSMPRHAFRAANRVRRFFSASRSMTRWPHGVLELSRRNSEGSLALLLTCLQDRASASGSPLLSPVFLTDCRFLVSANSFHFASCYRALLGAPCHFLLITSTSSSAISCARRRSWTFMPFDSTSSTPSETSYKG